MWLVIGTNSPRSARKEDTAYKGVDDDGTDFFLQLASFKLDIYLYYPALQGALTYISDWYVF